MKKSIEREALMELANVIVNDDDQVKIATLSDELTISQVVKFFERQGKSFTKTMIQNYVRVGVLPPPVDKRYYTRNHLILLTLIDSLKAVYSLEEIKMVLAPVRNNPEIFDDDIIETMDMYKNYQTLRKEALNQWKNSLPRIFDRVEELISEDGIEEKEKAIAMKFMLVMTIMAESIAMKDLINEIIKEYF